MVLVPNQDGCVGAAIGRQSRCLKIALLGSTGSVGTATLEVLRQFPERFSLLALVAGGNHELFQRQVAQFRPRYSYLEEPLARSAFATSGVAAKADSELLATQEDLLALLKTGEADIVVAAIVGFAGLPSVIAAIEGGSLVVLANKESLISAGALLSALIKEKNGALIPVDSEHSAIFQALQGQRLEDVDRIVVTASGGPFRQLPYENFATITPQQALKHPTWNMGAKITIDSASMVNKAFELAEAHWLFGIPTQQISVLVHPQSIIHSLVNFKDGSTLAQLGLPDMKVPIAYAINYPFGRLPEIGQHLDLAQIGNLEFYPLDEHKFRAPKLMLSCIDQGGVAAAVFTIANDIAVSEFLAERIAFTRIMEVIESALDRFAGQQYSSLSDLLSLRDTIVQQKEELLSK